MEEIIEKINNMDEIAISDPIIYELIKSSDYKMRFIAEYIELKIRYNNLHRMLVKHEAGTLEFTPTCDISVLEDQAYHMNNYLRNLEVRAEIEKIILPKI